MEEKRSTTGWVFISNEGQSNQAEETWRLLGRSLGMYDSPSRASVFGWPLIFSIIKIPQRKKKNPQPDLLKLRRNKSSDP
jgi:hypothetical protein